MRFRYLGRRVRSTPPAISVLRLRPILPTSVEPQADGRPLTILLDHAVAPDEGEAVLLIADPALMEIGLVPLFPVRLLDAEDEGGQLELPVYAPRAVVTLPDDFVVARLLFIDADATTRLSMDPDLARSLRDGRDLIGFSALAEEVVPALRYEPKRRGGGTDGD
jgi:hypothetical protein